MSGNLLKLRMGWPGAPPVAPTLAALTLQSSSASTGVAGSTNVLGRTVGSTLTLTNNVGGVFSINSATAVLSWSSSIASGANTPTIRETLAGATNTPRDTSPTVTASAVAKLSPGASWTGTQNSGFGGSAPTNPTRVHAKPTLRPLWPDHFVTFNDYVFVVDSGAFGDVASVTFTLEGGTPITKTAPELVTYNDTNGVSRWVFGFAAQIDNAATVTKAANGAATLSIESVANDGTMEHRVVNYTIYPRATEFTDTITVGASGKTVTSLKAALALAAAAGPGSGSPKRYCIQLADNNVDYVLDSQNTDYTTFSWWTVITTAPGVTTAGIGDGTQDRTFPGFGGICFRGSALKIDLAKVSYSLRGFRMPGSGDGTRLWFDGCELFCTTSANSAGGGSGAGAVYRGSEPDTFWINANAGSNPFEVYYTEVNAHDIPAYGLSFHLLRRNSTATNIGGSDDEGSYCTHGGYADKIGGYWSGQRTYQGAFDISYTGGATLAQFKGGRPGYNQPFELFEDSPTATYSFTTNNDPNPASGTWTSMADLIAWINTKPGWTATATSSTTALGASYTVLNGGSLTAAMPKTTANSTPVAVKRAADVHADVSVWTDNGSPITVENVSKRFFENRRAAGVDLFSVPAGAITAKDWCHRNYSNSDISGTVSEPTQPSVPGAGVWSHAFWQYISDTNPSGWVFSGTYDAYCNMDHSAGKFTWSNTPAANMSWTSTFFQQATAPSGAGANCKTSNVASSTLYTDYSATVPNFAPITSGSPPLRLTDLSYAGRFKSTAAEQGT